jgi:hypothetical protein
MKWAIPLLADSSPILRMRVLRDLLGRPNDDPEVSELRDLCDSDPLVANVLDVQNPDGSWSDEIYAAGGTPGASLDVTTLALTRLGYLGYDRHHPAVQRGAEYVFSQQESDGSWPLFRSHERDGGGIDTGYDLISLQTSMPLRGLVMCGYATDPRAEKAYDWLLEQRLLDGAWPTGISGGNYGYVAGYRRLAHSRWGCRTNTTAALICLAHHPERRTGDDARRALDLILGRETHERHHVGLEVARMIGVENVSGRFTYFARFDIALVLDLCWRVAASREDARIADMVDFILRWQGAFGLWEYVPRPEASRWLTFDLLRSLANLSADSDWQSTEPQTPFQPYTKTDRRY